MKAFLLFFCLTLGTFSFSQEHEYHYEITIQDVDDIVSAKLATTVFRDLFDAFPTFDDLNDKFDFYSFSTVTQTDLENVLLPEGFVVLTFTRTISGDLLENETE